MNNVGVQKGVLAPLVIASRACPGRSSGITANASGRRCFGKPPRHLTSRTAAHRSRAYKAPDAVSISIASIFACAGAAQAGETIPAELLSTWLDAVRDLGPLGPVAFVATISVCECVPFFPTQPLSICGGLLFGVTTGAFLNLVGLSAASSIAFTLSRTVGRDLAQAVIKAETTSSTDAPNPVAKSIADVEAAIEAGGPLQQFTAILLLRLTPVVPFSASNYVLGLSPVPYGPFLAATVTGMSVWSVLLASIGAAGKSLLTSGTDPSAVLSQVSGEAGSSALVVFGVAAVLAAGAAVMVMNPGLLPDPKDLGRPEAEAEVRRLRNLGRSEGRGGEEPEGRPLVGVRSSRGSRDD